MKESKAFLKKLNDMNQILKGIFTRYIVILDGSEPYIIGDQIFELSVDYAETSISFLKDFFNSEKAVIEIYSSDVYVNIKNHKKNCTSIEMDDNGIVYIIGENTKEKIAKCTVIRDADKMKIEKIDRYNNLFSDNYKSLDEDSRRRLFNKLSITIQDDNNKFIVSHKTFPNIKPDFDIDYCIAEGDISSYSFMKVRILRKATVVSYHIIGANKY